VRIATYNIHACVGGDRRFDPERIVAVIESFGADIVALQEVDTRGQRARATLAALDDLRGRCDFTTFVEAATMFHGSGSFGQVLLSKWPVESSRIEDVSVSGREPRSIIETGLRLPSGPLRMITAHLGLGLRERRLQSAALVELLDADPEVPTVVCGDLNEWRDAGPLNRALAGRMTPAPAGPTFPSRWPLWRLDRVWCRPGGLVRRAWRMRSGLSRIASDHLPVVAELDVSADAEWRRGDDPA